jgi:gas vesicle protein
MFLMAVILLNLLIAIMSDKHGEVKKQEKASANYNRAGIVVEYEKLMSAEEKKRPEYNPKYLQVLRPEKVIGDADSAEEIRELSQLMHDKTDALREDLKELKEENADSAEEIRELSQLMHDKTDALREDLKELKEENADSAEEIRELNQLMHDKTDALSKENADIKKDLKEDLKNEVANLKKELKEELSQENAELRRLFETQMASTSELKEMIAKVLAQTA